MDLGSFVCGGVAVGTIIFGLSSWLGKVWAERIMQKDRLKYETEMEMLLQGLRTNDSKMLYVHKLQFEKEFEIYKELWTNAIQLEQSVSLLECFWLEPDRFLKNMNDTEIQDFEPHQTFEHYKEDLSEVSGKFNHIVRHNKPFYSKRIFEKTNQILDIERKINERIDFHFEDDKSEIKQMCQSLSMSLNELCGLIRDCIWNNREE